MPPAPDADAADTTPELDTSLPITRWRHQSAVHAARALNTSRL
jgi:hypothetical protein